MSQPNEPIQYPIDVEEQQELDLKNIKEKGFSNNEI